MNTFSTKVKDEISEGGGRYRRSEVEGAPQYSNNFVRCGVGVKAICHSVGCRGHMSLCRVSRSYVTRLLEVDTDFKNVFTLKMYIFKI